MEHFDLCVIGGGPAGYAAAMRAIDLGRRTLLIERDRIGGTGIYNGALASKTLWEVAHRVSSTNALMHTRGREPFRLSWEEVGKAVNEAIFERKYLYACHMQMLANNKAGTMLFKHERGTGRFLSKDVVHIERPGFTTRIRADHFIIATGSRPRTVPDIPVDEQHIFTSDGIFAIDELPRSIVIIGAGVIGCEFATIFSNLGDTRVHLIDRADRILPFEDPDVSELVARNLERNGVIIHRSAKLEHIAVEDGAVRYDLSYTDGRVETVRVEKALLSVGRTPNIEGLGLEHTGILRDATTGLIQVSDTRTSVPNIHVVGDATATNMLVNLGEMEGRHAVERIWQGKTEELSYDNVSTIMFLDPEVAGVGLNEQECRKRGLSYRMARIDYSCIARAIAMRRTKGFFKVLVSNDAEMRVLGMRAVGEHASSAIEAVALMMRLGTPIRELAELVHPHPSITEGVQECARMLLGRSIFKPGVFEDRMQCYTWTPAVQTAVAAA
ncbi:MAG TPA: NAD(P)/FAD-dependent oxidoreductase [Flavobacteriales bacterium]|nr:NAD(P)/FAD-dependent oxidoreductase [Flavobacteriales bacterium]HNU55656.1 NAD(P)/FAD-dependent oxidoreductase [Flavobacteriales bacterium]